MIVPSRPARTTLALVLAWVVLVAAFTALSVRSAVDRAAVEVDAMGRSLHRLVSQRAAQHDAHLTSLSALALATRPPPLHEIDQVAATILRFYPRITAVDLLSLPGGAGAPDAPAVLTSTRSPTGNAVDPIATATAIAGTAPGATTLIATDAPVGRYRLAKKLPDSEGRLALVLEIDAQQLFDGEERPVWAALTLSTGDRTIVALPATAGLGPAAPSWLPRPHFEKALGSPNQPLLLRLERPLALADLVAPGPFATFAFASAAIIVLAGLLMRQRHMAKRARLAAAEAQQRARIREHEARLAHASRVNAMGEMASGIAHELTQPLTALLSQSQAALRLAAADAAVPSAVAEVLAANVRQAKRAADILTRLRAYVSRTPPRPAVCDLNALVGDVAALARIDLERRSIILDLPAGAPAPLAWVDPVQMEQVVHNLVRNAADAVETRPMGDRRVVVKTEVRGGETRITVADTGCGIAEDVLPRLFEPFFSTKADGMGLGLPLCQSLVERFGGHIVAANRPEGGAQFTVVLPLASGERRAEAAE
ncbi:HAMP domain-containing sensor histidine kinase [Chelatococcus sp. SYSU_G07232]|uniref:histidine kinase n=2 Tax=Chelatococcus albus TaxID=3047466 RepID=A0ABT7AIR7_9HYPH|nr:HAMP domain-containing sensor histidine kinase [Chelatococcus sp. SYSU_G07232]